MRIYSMLGEASLRSDKGVYVLLVGGFDGTDKYCVHVYFDAKRVIKRLVYDSFAPNKPLEETLYWPRPVIE